MKRFTTCLAALTIVLALNFKAHALGVGDPAPKLSQGKYVQGDAVKEFEKGKVYVMEFWATWCGPCIAAIPHVSELQKKHADKGLIVIGQNVWERDETKVAPFVEKMKDKMTYRVAMDDKTSDEKGAMATTWMEAAGQNGIPCSMIVNQEGVIAWIGHPMTMEKPLEQILAGKYDITKAKAEAAEANKAKQAFADFRTAATAGDEAKVKELVDAALANKATPAQNLMQMSNVLLSGPKKNVDAAEKLANGALEREKDEAQAHWLLGRVHAERGDFAKAIEAQNKAIAGAPEQMKEFLKKGLKEYEEKAAAKK
jgi:thiol-disulfide isomerase/thioredoxin